MTETTTIEVTKDQAEQLQERKLYDAEPYKSVMARILGDDNSAIDTEEIADLLTERVIDQIAIELGDGAFFEVDHSPVLNRIDDLETRLPSKVAEEVRNP